MQNFLKIAIVENKKYSKIIIDIKYNTVVCIWLWERGNEKMSKKAKIIVSISGIVLVMLILLGLTYAYFLTRIHGNTNNKSISVTTANLELTYGDNSAEILGKDLVLEPSDTEIGTKNIYCHK